MQTGIYSFKLADSTDEHAQIHALNYRTFVEEIPQHPPNPERIQIAIMRETSRRDLSAMLRELRRVLSRR